jgi:hypothetical protein
LKSKSILTAHFRSKILEIVYRVKKNEGGSYDAAIEHHNAGTTKRDFAATE